jgi:hypothetical protein
MGCETLSKDLEQSQRVGKAEQQEMLVCVLFAMPKLWMSVAFM